MCCAPGLPRRLMLLVPLLALAAEQPRPLRISRIGIPLRYVEHEFAIRRPATGVPTFDWKAFELRPPKIVIRVTPACVLENSFLRVVVLPDKGRVQSLTDRRTGREQLWINPAAKPIRAHNDTGFWVTWGGIENVLPRGEHGTSHALPWRSRIDEEAGRVTVRMWTVEPLTGLEHVFTAALYRDRNYLETTVEIRNPSSGPRRFSSWTTALLAPGGGELTPEAEIIVPAERFVPAGKPFNAWMAPFIGPAMESPLRFASGWRSIGDLMATEFLQPFAAVYSHERRQGIVRILDVEKTPGFSIWMWGFPPSPERQKEFTAAPPNAGYVEMWNGTARDWDNSALGIIAPGKTISWTEKTCVYSGAPARDLEHACR